MSKSARRNLRALLSAKSTDLVGTPRRLLARQCCPDLPHGGIDSDIEQGLAVCGRGARWIAGVPGGFGVRWQLRQPRKVDALRMDGEQLGSVDDTGVNADRRRSLASFAQILDLQFV